MSFLLQMPPLADDGLPQLCGSPTDIDPLFPNLNPAPTLDHILYQDIRGHMLSSRHIPPSGDETSAIATYLGQMIAHEIVPSSTLFPDLEVERTMNLGSLYGHSGPHNPRPPFDAAGRFIIGKLPGDQFLGSDLPRDCYTGRALIADPRNDENHLVSQMHTTWLRFHNCLVDHATNNSKAKPFEYAKEITIKAFQFVAITDFLFQVVDPAVYRRCTSTGPHILNGDSFDRIPDSFAFAGFRFGHSMVRDSYTLNRRYGRRRIHKMPDLFAAFRDEPFTVEEIVDWHTLDQQPAHKIDCGIVNAMNKPPFDGSQASIVEINLAQGRHLPAGYDCASFIANDYPDLASDAGLTPLNQDSLRTGRLHSLRLHIETLPLWLYVLQEARVSRYAGDRLGPLGGIIVAEVLSSSVKMSPHSISQLLPQSFDSWLNSLGLFGEFLGRSARPRRYGIKFLDVVEFIQSR